MSLLDRLKSSHILAAPGAVADRSPSRAKTASPSTPSSAPSFSPRTTRSSNSLKDFLWHLNGIGRGTLLDLGPVYQSTVTFFGERGFRVYTEDLLTGWKRFLKEQDERELALDPTAERPSRAQIATEFLKTSLEHKPRSFDAVLVWHLLDYLEDDMMKQTAERLGSLLRDGGVILAFFHSKRPERFQRFRVLDETTLEIVPAPPVAPMGRILQNREMMELFSRFHTSKTYLGRDQLREALFIK